ncbi:hypothetical protein BJ912DRAFT_1091540 [Pholiota molesta]|nr:hypothetical protein BJ912DRAFT_1091540 [Pholiota molesta]
MINSAHDELPQGSTSSNSQENYPPWEYPTSSHDTHHYHELASASRAPSPWHLSYLNYQYSMYSPLLAMSGPSFPLKQFDVIQTTRLPTWSDKSPAFPFGGHNDPTEALYADEAGQNIWDLLVDDTVYQASTPELDGSSTASTPSASAALLGTPVLAGPSTVWDAGFDIHAHAVQVQDPVLDYGFQQNLQWPFKAPVLPDQIYVEQAPLEFTTSVPSPPPASLIPSQTYYVERPSNAGERRTLARDARRRTLGPYTTKSRTSNPSPPATANVQDPSAIIQQPLSPSVVDVPQPSPPVDRSSVPTALLLPPRLSAITCTYDNCTHTAPFTGRSAWRTHLAQYHRVRGNSTAGGECRFPGCGECQADSIMRHVVTRHSGVALKCRQCGARFLREDSLKRHVRCAEGHRYFGGRTDVFYFDEIYAA